MVDIKQFKWRVGDVLSWAEVSGIHKTRTGIFQQKGVLQSLLTDLGKLSRCYPDFETAEGGMIVYTGAGRRGNQKKDIYNRALMDAIVSRHPVPLFCKLAVNKWEYMGEWYVVDSEYVYEEKNKRMVWQFVLRQGVEV